MKNMDFQMIGHVSHYVCDMCTLFQESDLPMKTALKLYVLLFLCPRKKEIAGNQCCTVCSIAF